MDLNGRLADLERELEATRRELADARAEAANGRFFRKLVEWSPDQVSVLDDDGRLAYLSPRFGLIFGETPEQQTSAGWAALVHPEDLARGRAAIEEARRSPPEHVIRNEVRRRHADGTFRPVESCVRNLLADPDVHGIAAYTREVSEWVRMREQLQRAQAYYELALRASNETFWELDVATMEVSPSLEEAFGYAPGELPRDVRGKSTVIHPGDRARVDTSLDALLAGGPSYDVEHRVLRKTGEYRWYRTVATAVRDASGAAVRIVGRTSDIHARKLDQIALRDSERMFRTLFEGTSVAVTIRLGDTYELVDCNAAALEMYGCATREELAAIPLHELAPPMQAEGKSTRELLDAYSKRTDHVSMARGDWLARRANGEVFPVDLRVTWITLEDGRWIMQVFHEDVTERKAVERGLRDRAKRDELVSRVSRHFVESDVTTALRFALESLGTFFGASRVRLRRFLRGGATLLTQHEWYDPALLPSVSARDEGTQGLAQWTMDRLNEAGYVAVADVEALPPDELALFVTPEQKEARAFLIVRLSNHGEIAGWFTVASNAAPRAWTADEIDVVRLIAEIVAIGSARADAEENLRVSEERYRNLVERSRDGVLIVDLESRVLYASPSVLELTGFTPEEWVTTPGLLFERLVPESRSLLLAVREEILVTKQVPTSTLDYAWRRKDGTLTYSNSSFVPIRNGAGELTGVQIISRDVTDRRLAEDARRQRAAHDELLSDVSRRFLNEAPEVATDATLERLGTAFDAERVSLFAPDESGARLRCTHRWLARDADVAFESLDGFPLPEGAFESNARCDAWLPALQRESGARILYAPIGYGGRILGLLAVRARAGRTWSDRDAATLRSIAELIAVGRVRRAAELALEKAKEDAVSATLMKSAFLANMSHELRTPLNGVIGMVDLLARTNLDERQRRYSEIARASARLLSSVINDILDFSKLEAGKLEIESIAFTLPELIEEVASILTLSAEEKGLELSCHSGSGLDGWLLGDPSRLRQVLVNLVSNAIKFTSAGEVSLRASVAAETTADIRVRIDVRDTGIGIPAAAQATLFQPFTQVDTTTTRGHGGTGLGLAICRELIERMGGAIGVTSAAGEGSTFWFEVPLTRPAGVAPPPPSVDGRLAGVRVLAVDDNGTNRELLRAHLTAAGMLCDTATDASTALAMLIDAHRAEPYRLALLDHRMPGVDGRELARRIRADARLSETRIVMIGSVARPLGVDEQRMLGISGYCTKPIWRTQLLRVLASALDAGTSADSGDAASHASRPVPIATRARILLVEDSPVNAEVAREILSTSGYEVDLATDGAQAVEAAGARAYALVLMDCQLPEMDGYEATRRIRALPGLGAVPVVALTASATREDVARCLASGMNDHVSKPVDARQLLAVIARQLAGEAGAQPAASVRRDDVPVAELAGALRRMGGDRALLRRIAVQFAEVAPESRAKLRAAVERRDGEAMAFAAHRLRGQAASFNAAALIGAVAALDESARRQNWTAAAALLLAVERELDRLLTLLAAERWPN